MSPSVLESVVITEMSAIVELQEPCEESAIVELQEPCEESAIVAPLPSLSEPCQLSASVDSGCLIAPVTFSSLSDQVTETRVLAPSSKTLLGEEVCDLLIDLEASHPGYGKVIARVLLGMASDGEIIKVEKSLRKMSKKKLGVARKSFAST